MTAAAGAVHYCSAPSRLMRHRAASLDFQRTILRLALFEPDIPQNAGTILRLAACLGVGVDLVEPFGFVMTDAKLRRAGLDYVEHAAITRHSSFAMFDA